MNRGLILPICILLGVLVLLGLGTWQVLRLQEKEALIARVEAQLKAPPIALDEAIKDYDSGKDIEFLPVELEGKFIPDIVRRYFITKGGKSGWYIYQPLILDDERVIWINRGFLPKGGEDYLDTPKDVVRFQGLLRKDLLEKPNSFVPDNDGVKNIYYWKNIEAFSSPFKETTLKDKRILPFFVDAGLPGEDKISLKGLSEGKISPQSGVSRVEFPNNHLQYAITWYGLALSCLGVGFAFWRSRRK